MPDPLPDPVSDPMSGPVPDSVPDPMAAIMVVNNEAGHRYEAWLGEALAGFTQYALDDRRDDTLDDTRDVDTRDVGLITFIHTQVADAYEGMGVASALIRGALDDVRAGTSRRVRPLCPFVKAFIQRHEDYQDLLYAADPLT